MEKLVCLVEPLLSSLTMGNYYTILGFWDVNVSHCNTQVISDVDAICVFVIVIVISHMHMHETTTSGGFLRLLQ